MQARLTHRRLSAFVLAATLLCAVGCTDATSSSPKTGTMETRVQALLDGVVGPELPGAAVCIRGDGIDLNLVAGKADIVDDITLRTDHRFHLASVGKSFIGVAFARLVGEGRVDLDDSLGTWLPAALLDGIPEAESITALHLLQHTSGIIDVHNEIDDLVTAMITNPGHQFTNAEQAAFAMGHPLHFAPGSAMRYSNTNYILLALILEQVTGQDHASALRKLVFTPLGMIATSTAGHEPLGGDAALGYMIEGADYDTALDMALRWDAGSGGQWSTAEELARFMHGVMATDLVLDDTGRKLLLTGSAHSTYGLGMDLSPTPYGPVAWHNGRLLGYEASANFFRDHGVAVTVLTNSVVTGGQGQPPADQLIIAILDELFGEKSP